ncbi:MAG: DUF6151 family protein [Burkholderiaceae bacterium]
MKTHALRCRCGTLQGELRVSRSATRALCYCADCQAYARFLASGGTGGTALDDSGGTEVVAMHPRDLSFTGGLDALACLSLRPRGLLRWYARCCRTPIGNTPRNPRIAYVGVVHSCLGEAAARRAAFGPVRIAVNTKSAYGPVPAVPLASRALAMFNLAGSLLAARLSGSHRQTPFFADGSRAPIHEPYVLTEDERRLAYHRDA